MAYTHTAAISRLSLAIVD